MNRYVVTFVHLKGIETPCIANKLVRATSKRHAVDIISYEYSVLKVLDVDRQFK